MRNLPKEELLSRLEAINRSNAIIYFDLNGFILGVNAIFLKAMGFQEDEHDKLIGKHHSIFVDYEYGKSEEYVKFWEVKSALFVIMSVGFITTIMYSFAILSNKDTQIIGSTWSNMFSVLLTNAFSIVGTIMGIKYATSDNQTK
jgi:hypothetical protein